MHLAGLDLNLLVVLDALLTEKSVTRAGQRIKLSQSATSAALSRLRHFFGDELLVPVGNHMMLTPHAIGIQEQVRDIILRTEAIARNKTAFVPAAATRHFRLIMSDYPATVLMPNVLAQAHKAAPGLTFEILPVSDPDSDELERGEADLRIMPQQWISRRHPSEHLYGYRDSGQITHSLATAIIGPDGKLVTVLAGNAWRPEDVLKLLHSALTNKHI